MSVDSEEMTEAVVTLYLDEYRIEVLKNLLVKEIQRLRPRTIYTRERRKALNGILEQLGAWLVD
jgi:hypothetical protein